MSTNESDLELQIAKLKAAGAPDLDVAEYRNLWNQVHAQGAPTDTSPAGVSFGAFEDLNVEPDDDSFNPIKAIGAMLSGAWKGVGNTANIPFVLGETHARMRTGVRLTKGPASFVDHGVDEVATAIKAFTNSDTDSSLGLRYLEAVSENVSVGAATTKAMTKWGQKLMRSLPTEAGALQRMAIEAAKNPKKIQVMEALINTGSAVSGQTVYETVLANGASPEEAGWWKVGTELASGLGLSNMERLVARLKDVKNNKLALSPSARARMAERAVGQFFDDVMSTDPLTAQKYLAARRIEDIYKEYTGDASGLELTTAQITRSSPVVTAERKIIAAKPHTAVQAQEHMRQQALKTQQFVDAIKRRGPQESVDDWQQDVRNVVNRQISDLQGQIDDSVRDAEKEGLTLLEQGDPVALGNLGRQKLDTLYDEYTKRIDAIYKTVEDVEIPITHVKSGWGKAMESSLKGNEGGQIDKYVRDLWELNFSENAKSSVAKLREFQKIVRTEMRHQSPKSDTYRRLATIDEGIQAEFGAAASKGYETNLGKAAQHLEIANKLNKEVSGIFNQAEIKRLIAEDAQGVSIVSAEDFLGRFIRSNNQKDSISVVKSFTKAFGSPHAPGPARDLIKQAYLVALRNSNVIDPVTKTINTRAASAWVMKHSANLQAFGLYDDFDNIGSAAKKAAEIKATNSILMKDIEKGILAHSIKDDPKEYVRKNLESGRLGSVVRGLPDAQQRGYKQLAWELLIESTDGGKRLGAGDTAVLIREPEKLGHLLETNAKDLKKMLGEQHYNDLKTLQHLMETTKPVHPGKFEGPLEAIADKTGKDRRLKAGIWSKLWAAHRGFVSPEFAAAYVLNQAVDSMSWKSIEGTLEMALKNPETARVLAQAARNREEAHALRSIYSAVIAPLGNVSDLSNDDKD